MVEVVYGVNKVSRDDLNGKTVEDIRELFADALSIPEDATPRINGTEVGACSTLRDGDVLEFTKKHGEKGSL